MRRFGIRTKLRGGARRVKSGTAKGARGVGRTLKPIVPGKRKVIAGGLAVAVIGGTASYGAMAAPIAENSALQASLATGHNNIAEATPSNDELLVTIGKTVAMTTDQNGSETPFKIMLVNGQVSGQGTGEVDIPLGGDSSKEVPVNSQSGEVSNFFDLGSLSYDGDLPVTMWTDVKVNGEAVDPNKAYNLTGDVEVTYTWKNHTSRQQTVNYTNFYGEESSAEVNVPVPFGVSFSTTFGDGWSIVEAGPSVANTIAPGGNKLSSTIVLFPLLEGVMGGLEQSVTIKARADNASLPDTKSLAVPVDLRNAEGGLALKLNPLIQDDVIGPVNSYLNRALVPIYHAISLVAAYATSFDRLALEYIDPILLDIAGFKVDPKNLESDLDALADGLDQASLLMLANGVAMQRIGGIVETLADQLGIEGNKLITWLDRVTKEIAPAADDAADGIAQVNKLFANLDPDELTADTDKIGASCSVVGATSETYGFGPIKAFAGLYKLWDGTPGYNSLEAAIKKGTPILGSKKQWAKDLTTLQTQLDKQSSKVMLPSAISGLVAESMPASIKPFLANPVCETVDTLVDDYIVPLGGFWKKNVAPYTNATVKVLREFSAWAESEAEEEFFRSLRGDLKKLQQILSNDQCTDQDILKPLLALIEGGDFNFNDPAFLQRLETAVFSIIQNCGVAQVIEFFGDVDTLIGNLAKGLGQIARDGEKDVPAIAEVINKITDFSKQASNFIENDLEDDTQKLISFATGSVDKVADLGRGEIGKLSNFAAQLGATLEAMNERSLSGDGAPYGAATGPNTHTLTAYQITQEAAAPYGRTWVTGAIVAAIFLILAVGVGTVMYRRRVG